MGVKRKINRKAEGGSILLQSAFDEFIEEKQATNRSKDTIRNYKQSFKKFMEFNDFDEATTTEEVSQSTFFKWQNVMLQEGLSVFSVNHYLQDSRAFFMWCMEEGREYIKPAFKILLAKAQEVAPKYFSEENIEKLYKKPDKKDSFVTWRTWAMAAWVMGTGNRAASVCNVKWEDIDFKKNVIQLTHTKNKSASYIPLSKQLVKVLRVYEGEFDKSEEDWVFPNIGGEKLTTNALRHAFSNFCKDREVDQTNIHGLRHSFARNFMLQGGAIFKLQEILGHKTLDMTRRYVKLLVDDLKEDFEDFSLLDTTAKGKNRTQKMQRR